jgi:hypothetical protein
VLKVAVPLALLMVAAWWYLGAPGWPHDEHLNDRMLVQMVRTSVESQVNRGQPLHFRSNKSREVNGTRYVCGEYYLRIDGDTAGPRAAYAGTLHDVLVEGALPDSAGERFQQAWTLCNSRDAD